MLWPRADVPSGNAAPPKAGASPQPPVPAGYRLKEARRGPFIPVRDGWAPQDRPGNEVTCFDPTRPTGLRVDVVIFASVEPLRH